MFLTAGKDSYIMIWRFLEEDDLVAFQQEIDPVSFDQGDIMKVGSITKAKWIDEQVVVTSLTDGSI